GAKFAVRRERNFRVRARQQHISRIEPAILDRYAPVTRKNDGSFGQVDLERVVFKLYQSTWRFDRLHSWQRLEHGIVCLEGSRNALGSGNSAITAAEERLVAREVKRSTLEIDRRDVLADPFACAFAQRPRPKSLQCIERHRRDGEFGSHRLTLRPSLQRSLGRRLATAAGNMKFGDIDGAATRHDRALRTPTIDGDGRYVEFRGFEHTVLAIERKTPLRWIVALRHILHFARKQHRTVGPFDG